MSGLYKLQVLLVAGVFFVPAWTSMKLSKLPCFAESDLDGEAEKKLHRHYQQPSEPRFTTGPKVCDPKLYRQSDDIANRSISPWRYIANTNDARFPRTIAEAQCLCDGCIMINDEGVHEHKGYNSRVLLQNRMVLMKEKCEDGRGGYSLRPTSVRVAVGCTCVKASIVVV